MTTAGEAALIANGREAHMIRRIFAGEKVGTLFYPTRGHMAGKKRWIGYGARSRGEIVVDEGAAKALKEGGKSLLPSGIVGVKGEFAADDVVNISVRGGETFARGVVSYGAGEVREIMGARTSRDSADTRLEAI